MTVGELLRRMSSREIAEWHAEDRIRAAERAAGRHRKPGEVPPEWRPA